jgi:hypothetical protein
METLHKGIKMTPDKQRTAIAEACGWRECWINQNGEPWGFLGALHYSQSLPDYLNDLNAMREAEEVLAESQQSEFADRLNTSHKVADLTYPEPNTRGFRKALFSEAFHLIHATAAQRAEAFLKTLELWEETK